MLRIEDLAAGTVSADSFTVFTKAKAPTLKQIKSNRPCYLNIILSDVVCPLLATRGQTLTKEKLIDSLKTNQKMPKKITETYTKWGVEAYDNNAFPFLPEFQKKSNQLIGNTAGTPSRALLVNTINSIAIGKDQALTRILTHL